MGMGWSESNVGNVMLGVYDHVSNMLIGLVCLYVYVYGLMCAYVLCSFLFVYKPWN